jgi:hypothetical protein
MNKIDENSPGYKGENVFLCSRESERFEHGMIFGLAL